MPNRKKPLVVVTRKLPDIVETRMRELFDTRLNLEDKPLSNTDLAEALATADVLDRAGTVYHTETEPLLLKGKEQAVIAHVVGDVMGPRPKEPPDLTPIVGREAELAVLSAAIDSARMRQLQLVEIVAEPGLGKSRLVQELRVKALGFQQLVIEHGDSLLRVGDIADVVRRPRDGQPIVTRGGDVAIEMTLMRATEADALHANRVAKGWLEEARANLPDGVSLTVYNDIWVLLGAQLQMVANNAWSGLLLVVVTMLMFLNGRVALWVTVGVPGQSVSSTSAGGMEV